jgi:hypothetical protein
VPKDEKEIAILNLMEMIIDRTLVDQQIRKCVLSMLIKGRCLLIKGQMPHAVYLRVVVII